MAGGAGGIIPASSLATNKGGGGTAGGVAGDYLESYDNVSSWLALTCDKKGVGWFIAGECQNGHRFAKELVCGKEWCGVCGEDGSVAHLRRFARWLPKVQQLGVMGYFVFTIPQELRSKYRAKKALSKLGHQVQELLKAFGYSRGLRRWHWFGDKSTKWHPHLNCLVDGGFVSPAKLDAIKRGYASLLGADVVDVNYRYRLSPGKMVHSLKYVTRSTFRDYAWDLEMALELRGFRNMVVWGRGQWDGEAAWSLADLGGEARAEVEDLDIEAIEALAEKRCPVCGERIEWEEALPIGLLDMVDKRSLGAGYWRLADNKSPPVGDKYHPKYSLLGYLANIKHCRLEAAKKRAEAEAAIEADYQTAFWRDILN
jgi:rRNA maturation protein Nop10